MTRVSSSMDPPVSRVPIFPLDNKFPKWEIPLVSGRRFRQIIMRVISRKRLNEFAKRFPEAKAEMDAWFYEAKGANWANPAHIKMKYGNASILKGCRVVFNICGNKYWLIVKINYHYSVVYVRFLGTHREYDQINAEEI